MVAISYWHSSRVNSDTEQKEHTSQPCSPTSPHSSPSSLLLFLPPSFCHLFSVLLALALSWLKQQQPGQASRHGSNTLTFSNPHPSSPLHLPSSSFPHPVQPPWRCCRHAPVCGDSFSLLHMLEPYTRFQFPHKAYCTGRVSSCSGGTITHNSPGYKLSDNIWDYIRYTSVN